jgi:hypothetical protein
VILSRNTVGRCESRCQTFKTVRMNSRRHSNPALPLIMWRARQSSRCVGPEIGEILNRDEPVTLIDFDDVISQARLLFTSPGNEEFKTKFQSALQRGPSVVMAHPTVMQLSRQDH